MADKDQKKYAPSGKRIADARRRGDTPTAPEIRHAAAFAAMLVILGAIGIHAFSRVADLAAEIWGRADEFRVDGGGAQAMITGIAGHLALIFAPLFATLIAFALLGGMLHGMPTISWSRVAPKWSKLSPASGLQRLIGMPSLIEFAKTLAKLSAILIVTFLTLRPHIAALGGLVGADARTTGAAAGGLVLLLVKAIAVPVGALALFDLVYQRHNWIAKLKMTLQEVKDEHKDSDGDPKIKGKMREIAIRRSRQRMMAAVPQASVVITNPTHYAVALRYDHGKMGAPVVVAKGTDAVALKIREIATAAGVPIVENRPLARALHASAEIDHPIPTEHYAAVAEIIGYVMRLARRAG